MSRPDTAGQDAQQPFAFGRLRLSPKVMMQALGEEAVLLDLRSENYFALNRVGVRVWQLLGECGDVDQVYRQLLEEFETEPVRVATDIEALVRKLLDAGLVERESARTP